MASETFIVDTSNLEGFTVDNTEGTFKYPSGSTSGRITFSCVLTVDSGKVVVRTPVLTVSYIADTPVTRTVNGVLQSDGTYRINANLSITPYADRYSMGSARINGRAIENEIMSKYGFVGAYKASKSDIVALANIRFYVDTGVSSERIDLGKYILSYVHYPFAVETENTAHVVLGFYSTSVVCELVAYQYKNLVLFDGIINGVYGNDADVNNVDIKIRLPYYGMYTLASDCINKRIRIEYQVDLLSNDCLIKIMREGEIIDTLTATVGYEEPFITKESSLEQTFMNKMNSNPNKGFGGCILVYQKENPTPDRLAVRIRKTVGELSGYVKGEFDSFVSNGDMTAVEIEMIKNAFGKGVVLNTPEP